MKIIILDYILDEDVEAIVLGENSLESGSVRQQVRRCLHI